MRVRRRSYIVVLMTAPPGRTARRLARILVEKRLAACVNIVPKVDSIYRWKGKIERAGESLLVVKTEGRRLPRLILEVRRIHPYTLPEIIALPLSGGHADYLRWVTDCTRAPASS
jgi:periplasmic divalent cation tolerance protein